MSELQWDDDGSILYDYIGSSNLKSFIHYYYPTVYLVVYVIRAVHQRQLVGNSKVVNSPLNVSSSEHQQIHNISACLFS